ncbi:hypothetical protein GCM10011613_09670 [Cellvibrio zantedeschiae]|uniref:Uncharacterized protein n=1 Tax=Cellvibrio zantedeschiae TaxID=1237077 RepID=A0ABQ3AXZ0_9GAMM|nr:hypothetical protein GCM10011613_09670 [Cellvibrio zantedeschiae]
MFPWLDRSEYEGMANSSFIFTGKDEYRRLFDGKRNSGVTVAHRATAHDLKQNLK